MFRILVPGMLALFLLIHPALGADKMPPATPKKPVTDTYHGIKVVDPYRWLENGDDAAVRKWDREQNQYARHYLDKLSDLAALRKRLTELNSATSADYLALTDRGGKLFALKVQPPKNQPFLVTLASADDPKSEKSVVDPNKLNAKGTTAIDFYVPSLDGKRVAVSLSEGGSEEGTVHVYETATGKELEDVIPRVNGGTAGGSVAWNADGSGFWYTRYPRGNERPKEDLNFYQQVYFHKLGTSTEQGYLCPRQGLSAHRRDSAAHLAGRQARPGHRRQRRRRRVRPLPPWPLREMAATDAFRRQDHRRRLRSGSGVVSAVAPRHAARPDSAHAAGLAGSERGENDCQGERGRHSGLRRRG